MLNLDGVVFDRIDEWSSQYPPHGHLQMVFKGYTLGPRGGKRKIGTVEFSVLSTNGTRKTHDRIHRLFKKLRVSIENGEIVAKATASQYSPYHNSNAVKFETIRSNVLRDKCQLTGLICLDDKDLDPLEQELDELATITDQDARMAYLLLQY